MFFSKSSKTGLRGAGLLMAAAVSFILLNTQVAASPAPNPKALASPNPLPFASPVPAPFPRGGGGRKGGGKDDKKLKPPKKDKGKDGKTVQANNCKHEEKWILFIPAMKIWSVTVNSKDAEANTGCGQPCGQCFLNNFRWCGAVGHWKCNIDPSNKKLITMSFTTPFHCTDWKITEAIKIASRGTIVNCNKA